jgi:hypothetical protein
MTNEERYSEERMAANDKRFNDAEQARKASKPFVYCVDCGAGRELECICDDLNFADNSEPTERSGWNTY